MPKQNVLSDLSKTFRRISYNIHQGDDIIFDVVNVVIPFSEQLLISDDDGFDNVLLVEPRRKSLKFSSR